MTNSQIFLCHASEDKEAVIAVYDRLKKEGFKPWLDKEDLLPGQIWAEEIPKAIKASDFALVFLSTSSVSKRGYIHKEFRIVLEILDEIPQGRVFVIPVKLDDCKVPDSFTPYHWINLYEDGALEKLIGSIRKYAAQFSLSPSALSAAREPLEVSVERAEHSIKTLQSRLFHVPSELLHKYEVFLSADKAGIVKILAEGKYGERILGVRNGGSWFSFSQRSHDAFNEADICLTNKWSGNVDYQLCTGFKGLHYGFFLPLGDTSIDGSIYTPSPPPSLPQGHHRAWSYMWSYTPPLEVKRARTEQFKFQRGMKVGEISLTELALAKARNSYLLRSINFRVSDLLIAIRIEERLEDDSVIMLWKILAEHAVPIATGPEPFGFDRADILAEELRTEIGENSNWKSEEQTFAILCEELDPRTLAFLKQVNLKPLNGYSARLELAHDLIRLQSEGLLVFWPRVISRDDLMANSYIFLTSAGNVFARKLAGS